MTNAQSTNTAEQQNSTETIAPQSTAAVTAASNLSQKLSRVPNQTSKKAAAVEKIVKHYLQKSGKINRLAINDIEKFEQLTV